MNKQCNFRTTESGSWRMAVCLLAIVFVLSACGFDGRADHQSNETSETGSFACTLVWPESLDDDGHTSPSARALNCEAAGIDSVVFTFFQNGTEADQIGFECTDHEGEAVLPVGSGYEVIITAEDADGTSWYQAEYGPFSITAGGTTSPPGGIIEMISVVVGEWNVYYDWDCDGTDGIAIFTVDSDNTLTVYDPFYGETYYGTWSILADQITGSLSDGSVYIGTFDAGLNQMEGTMADASSYAGCWTGVPYGNGGDTDDNYEENDSVDEATPLAQDVYLSSMNGYGVAVAHDYDYFKIVVPYTSATIQISCEFIDALGDIDIELFDAAGDWIDIGDQGMSGDDNETIVYNHASGASPTTYYIKVYLYSEGDPNTYDLIWDTTPTVDGVNLTGDSFSVSPDVLVWGQSLDINWAITNNGTQAIPAGTYVDVDFFLSEDAAITINDYWLDFESLDQIFSNGLVAGSGVFGTINVPLPTASPFVSSSGTFYIGMVIDVYGDVAETDENDNSSTGAGVDYAPVSIAQ